ILADTADWYSVNVTSPGSGLRFSTSTPADGPGQFVNTLNPHIELYDPSNTLVATGVVQADGRNEVIQYTPLVAGNYRVRVTAEGSTTGEYFLSTAGLGVTSTTPSAGSVVSTPPSTFVVNFSDAIDPATLDAGDLKVNSLPADAVALSADGKTAT